MSTPELNPDYIRAGWALQAFDDAGIDVDAAFYYLEDDSKWTFYIHTTHYELSERQVYAKLLEALKRFPGALPLEDIELLPAKSGLLDALRSAYSFGLDSPFGKHNTTEHLHVGNTTFGGYFVRWLVLYRL